MAESIFTNTLQNAADSAYGGTAPTTSLTGYIGSLISAIFGLLGIVFFVLFVYAGILWMTARGESKQVEKAQTIMREALIGLVITLSSYAVSLFVVKILEGI